MKRMTYGGWRLVAEQRVDDGGKHQEIRCADMAQGMQELSAGRSAK